MFAVSATRTNQSASAAIANLKAKKLEQERQRLEAEKESKAQILLEAKRREMERREAEKRRLETYHNIVASYREVGIRASNSRLSIKDIITGAIEGTAYTYDDIIGGRRMRAMTNLRHFAIVSAWAFRPDMSLPAIGRQFGGRDHTTILHSKDRFGFESREEAAAFISRHGREATIARLSKQAA